MLQLWPGGLAEIRTRSACLSVRGLSYSAIQQRLYFQALVSSYFSKFLPETSFILFNLPQIVLLLSIHCRGLSLSQLLGNNFSAELEFPSPPQIHPFPLCILYWSRRHNYFGMELISKFFGV
jgi:hypothetical protein